MSASTYRPLLCLTLTHMLVDACQYLISPLWAQFQASLHFSENVLFLVLSVQALSPSVSQAAFGYARDRYSAGFLLWLGPVVAAVSLSLLGIASSTVMLCTLLLVGGTGVGAFHPEAAVGASNAIPGARARGLSLFLFGGALGLGLGPILSGTVVGQFGLQGLVYLGPILVAIVAALHLLGMRHIAPREVRSAPKSIVAMLDGRVLFAISLLLVCSLRLVPNMAVDKVLAFTLSPRGWTPLEVGLAQAIFLASGGVGMLLMAFRFRTGWERPFMIACPLAGIPLLAILGWRDCPLWLLLATLVPAGVILWGTTSAMIAYAHQQLPNGTGIASALTMGMSWGVGGMIQAKITSGYVAAGAPQQAFHAFIPCLALAAIGAWLLPRPQPHVHEAAETTMRELQPAAADV